MQGYAEYLLSNIKPWARLASGGSVINCRCFYCRDSATLSHGHFYISIPTDKDPSLFYCQKCKAKGIVTSDKLIEWGLFNPEIGIELRKHNANVLSNPVNSKYRTQLIYRLFNPQPKDDELSRFKLKYINDRLGTNLSYDDCIRLKIVLNLNELLMMNNITNLSRDSRIVEALDAGFIGFISIDNSFVNLRNVGVLTSLHQSIDKRYVNYNIFNKYDNTNRFYTIPCSFNIEDTRPLQLHIAEGAFDILSIKLNLRQNEDRAIFTSIGGSGYKGILRYFITTLKIPNLEIHMYPDMDISRREIEDVHGYVYQFRYPFYIHQNMQPGEKDFGVPINRISESISKL